MEIEGNKSRTHLWASDEHRFKQMNARSSVLAGVPASGSRPNLDYLEARSSRGVCPGFPAQSLGAGSPRLNGRYACALSLWPQYCGGTPRLGAGGIKPGTFDPFWIVDAQGIDDRAE